MAKYDEQLNRMNYLMKEYKTPQKAVESSVKYHANGADGKVYGIIREGNKFYIKETESGKENIAESYDYIGGFMNKKANEYRSYNDATKQLELHLISLNEAYGKKGDVSTVDFKRNEKGLAYLTEEARKSLDRMHQILENSNHIGDGAATRLNEGEITSKPVVGPKADKAGNVGKDDVFTEKAKNCEKGECNGGVASGSETKENNKPFSNSGKVEGMIGESEDPAGVPTKQELSGSDDLDQILKEFMNDGGSVISGGNKVLTHQGNPIKGTHNGVDGEDTEEWKRIEEAAEQGDEEFLKNYDFGNDDGKTLDALSWDKVTDHDKNVVKALTESIFRTIVSENASPKNRASIKAYIGRLVNEEVTRLQVFGEHPKFGHEPFTYDDNHEVLAGTADRDFNDDSAKGRQRYGKKIGKGDPFNQMVTNVTDDALANLKESIRRRSRRGRR